MKIEKFTISQRFFQASLLDNGNDVDDGTGDAWSSRAEAEADGEEMVAAYDPEYRKRHRDAVEFYVREFVADSICDDGAFGAAHTID